MPTAKKTRRTRALNKDKSVEITQPVPSKVPPASGIGRYLSDIFANKTAFLAISILSLTVGTASQLNWIQLKCGGNVLFTNQADYCRLNLLRLILGGPVAFILMCTLIVFLRQRNEKLTLKGSIWFLYILSPLAFLPFIVSEAGKVKLTSATALVFLIFTIYHLRADIPKLLKRVVGKPEFRMKIVNSQGVFRIDLSGKLLIGERDWMMENLLEAIFAEKRNIQKISLNVTNLATVTPEFSFMIFIIIGCARREGVPLEILGSESQKNALISLIETEIQHVFI